MVVKFLQEASKTNGCRVIIQKKKKKNWVVLYGQHAKSDLVVVITAFFQDKLNRLVLLYIHLNFSVINHARRVVILGFI